MFDFLGDYLTWLASKEGIGQQEDRRRPKNGGFNGHLSFLTHMQLSAEQRGKRGFAMLRGSSK